MGEPADSGSWTDYTAPTDTGGGDTADLRDWLRQLGIPIPTTLSDLEAIGKELRATLDQIDKLDASQAAGWSAKGAGLGGLIEGAVGKIMTGSEKLQLRQRATELTEKLYDYAGNYFGTQGQTVISRTLRPPTPEVSKLPTAEEFLSDYGTAYATHIEGMKKAGQLTSEEAAFANDVMKNESYQTYLSRLGEFANAGTSPFSLQEVSREERGIGADTPAGAALDKALGPGVTEPTTVTGTGTEVSEAIDQAGQGVAKEFISKPRLAPLDFLRQNLSVSDIKIKYAGSAEGAGKTARRVPAGFVSNPRR